MFDPIELSKKVASVVCKGGSRKYYRFRGGRFYGGSSAADVVGCNLRCAFCWSVGSRRLDIGKLYTPEEVSRKLIEIAERAGYPFARITGGEPTLCSNHLVRVIENVSKRLTFILETNGILLGHDEELAKRIASFDNLLIRVSIKAATPEWFSRVTGASPRAFDLQIKALENVLSYGKEPPWLRVSLVVGYGSEEEYAKLLERLYNIHPKLIHVEWEILTLYPKIKRRLERMGLLPWMYREGT